MTRILEICIDSLASARAAIRGGADRLELCSALTLGGLTPYTALLKQIREESDIPIRCLVRCRSGDFLYTHDELLLMATQIRELKAAGADGFVIGCLTADGDLDRDALAPLIEAADGARMTLHRCIDVSRDPIETYRNASEIGVDSVLTSGASANCIAGLKTLEALLTLRDESNGPEILIGAGVNIANIHMLVEKLPTARAFHSSCKKMLESSMHFRRDEVPMGLPGLDEWHIQQTDETQVRRLKEAIC